MRNLPSKAIVAMAAVAALLLPPCLAAAQVIAPVPAVTGEDPKPPANVELVAVDRTPNRSDDDDDLKTLQYDPDPIKTNAGFPLVEEVPVDPEGTAGGSATRSIGGDRSPLSDARWQAQIYQTTPLEAFARKGLVRGRELWELQHICGGSLIAAQWIVTAAHCLSEDDVRHGYRVRLGSTDLRNDEGWTYRIDRIIRYNSAAEPRSGPWRIDDIALVHFVDDRGQGMPDPRRVRAIPLDRLRAPADEFPVFATGWGRLENSAIGPAAVLMKVELHVIAQPRCAAGPWGPRWAHAKTVCAAFAGRQTCQGDSGGPLVNRDGRPPRLIGVVSWNNADCIGDRNRPGVYTRVADYANWITAQISEDLRQAGLRRAAAP